MNWKGLLAVLVCWLGLHNGHLAVFGDGPEPLLVLPYREELFSQDDRQKLREGIPFENEEELTRLLQDYLS